MNLDFFAFTLISPTVGRGLWGKFTKIKKYEDFLEIMVKEGSVIVFLYFLAQTNK